MAKVSVLSMVVRENPSLFHRAFWFEISFECNEALADYLEWKIVYIGSDESHSADQGSNRDLSPLPCSPPSSPSPHCYVDIVVKNEDFIGAQASVRKQMEQTVGFLTLNDGAEVNLHQGIKEARDLTERFEVAFLLNMDTKVPSPMGEMVLDLKGAQDDEKCKVEPW
ncbi:hypothetical protein MJG53_014297 [Ovis ammon polii x Ovis aries]|uniref:Uncharacterized protein n=1 Tax=Ovis ammon polii x Ovis aries TaxID=2918886 RepID=A0ACB9UG57_9CETA|nr:hypothetical protein MJG53_014297 [Ovis ammon polii x Ovis aries]